VYVSLLFTCNKQLVALVGAKQQVQQRHMARLHLLYNRLAHKRSDTDVGTTTSAPPGGERATVR